MVIGDVQSGKTQNYSALINKVSRFRLQTNFTFTGTTEELRRQTQERINESFIGHKASAGVHPSMSQNDVRIGVGKKEDIFLIKE